MSDSGIKAALDRFVQKFNQLHTDAPLIPYNAQWPSDCYQENAAEGTLVRWRPTPQRKTNDMFIRIGEALEESIHPDVEAFYSQYWSDPLPATCHDGDLSLIQAWNSEDMERLRSNLVGHALSKRQQKRPLTFFIACTEPDDDYFISVDNYSGEIWLETPGKPPIRKLADNLSTFLLSVEPRKIKDME
ncbi:SecY-interacting protein [uncultured Neptuniibacter sp.]|uniref:SecY-interacting protein n=1 Tax=uncultured Neptuniibacter sp. TaxID=502143 RepID=UPI002626DCF1|nr:SecY-interacting protein [uncultured Neptuniibacter sp.]